MKIKLKNKTVAFSLEVSYFVYELRSKNNDKFVIVENDDNQVLKYDLSMFEIVEPREPNGWITVVKENGEEIRTYPEFKNDDFWEKFHNDDTESLKSFNCVKTEVFGSCLDNNECLDIINSSNINNQTLLLEALSKYEREEFVDSVIQLVRDRFYQSAIKHEFLLEYAFTYLSRFSSEKVEKIFLEYYENIEMGTARLTSIVDAYFSKA